MQVGETFLDLKATTPPHLWIVCSNPNANGDVVIVNLTKLHAGTIDDTCVLQRGDHPFVSTDTAVRYQSADVKPVRELEAKIQKGDCKHHQPASDQLMTRIREGAVASDYTPNRVKRAVMTCRWRPSA